MAHFTVLGVALLDMAYWADTTRAFYDKYSKNWEERLYEYTRNLIYVDTDVILMKPTELFPFR